ncbi:MAG: hypothetical protein QM754_21200 [Tepidisphaeraceae bacterium]
MTLITLRNSNAADRPQVLDGDQDFDPQTNMVWGKVTDKGYHTLLPPNSRAHPVRSALKYALVLLETGERSRVDRAEAVLKAALALQITDPTRAEFGIWPYFLEEPIEKMAPPDWNWADFCGSQLAEILAKHETALSPELRNQTRAALSNAAWSIFRRNVQPNYTNIAIMGAGVCCAAGELLNEPALLNYGRQRLTNCVIAYDRDGGFNEYNSPSYTTIVLTECERIGHLVKDPASREAAERLRYGAWKTIAESYHPATGQWAGPHSRVYSDRLGSGWAKFFADQSGAKIPFHPDAPGGGPSGEVDYGPCPDDLEARFVALPTETVELRRRFIRRDDESKSTYGTTWLSPVACLGSVNYDSFWTQRRPVIAYWKTADDPAVVLKLRFLHDGKDFASAGVRTTQSGGQAVSLVSLLLDRGDHHDTIDKPKDGIFLARSFLARYELTGIGARVERVSDRTFDLIAGNTTARVTVGPGKFNGSNVVAAIGHDDKSAWVDAVLYDGPARGFRFADLTDAWATLGLSIQTNAAPITPAVEARDDANDVTATFGKLSVTGPRHATSY